MGCIECKNVTNCPCIDVPPRILPLQIESQTTLTKQTIVSQPKLIIAKEEQVFHRESNELIMLNELNNARTNPKEFANKINDLIEKIDSSDGNNMLVYDDNLQIELEKGKVAFESCINFLNSTSELKPLKYVEELNIPFPSKNPELVLNRDYLMEELAKKSKQLNGKYSIIDFHYDCSPHPVLSALIQVIDDSTACLQRRNNILRKDAKYIGISSGLTNENIYCYYLLFAC